MGDRADRVIRFCHKHIRIPDGALVGQPVRLADFQIDFIRAVYSDDVHVRRAYLSVARKQGKTALIAMLLLVHLVGPESKQNTQLISGARSRDQAGIVFDLASKMVRLNPYLSKIIRIIPSQKKLIGLLMGTEYRAISAEAKTAHGLSPVLAILDEVGQVVGPQDDFVDAIVTSQGAHDNPLLIAISTQAPTDADLFSIWIDDAERSKDPRIVSHVYRADESADVMDEAAWRAANPALGIFRSLDDLREQAIQASRMPSAENAFRNLCLNQRISTVSPFVSRSAWQDCGNYPDSYEGQAVFAGLDLSARTDLTSFVLIFEANGFWHVHPFFWTPEDGLIERSKRDRAPYDVWVRDGFLRTTPGASVDYAFVAAEIADILSGCNVSMLAFDRWRMDLMKRELDSLGIELPLEPFGQGFKDMSPALDLLESELLNKRILHGNHPVLTMCAANAVVRRDEAGNRKLDKSKTTGRIDGMVALAMAMGCKTKASAEPEPSFDMFFV